MARRRCARTFTILAGGGVLIRWSCGAEKVCPDEIAVDVEYLADHLPTAHHHKHHLHKEHHDEALHH